jgi:hypothetical protein
MTKKTRTPRLPESIRQSCASHGAEPLDERCQATTSAIDTARMPSRLGIRCDSWLGGIGSAGADATMLRGSDGIISLLVPAVERNNDIADIFLPHHDCWPSSSHPEAQHHCHPAAAIVEPWERRPFHRLMFVARVEAKRPENRERRRITVTRQSGAPTVCRPPKLARGSPRDMSTFNGNARFAGVGRFLTSPAFIVKATSLMPWRTATAPITQGTHRCQLHTLDYYSLSC